MNENVLREQTVLVTGATGEVGWGIAHAAVEAGAHVLLPTRSERGAAHLTDEFREAATVVQADVSTDAGVERVMQVCDHRGPLHHVAAPVGAFWNGGLTLDQEPAELTTLLDTYVVTQLRLARATVPRLEHTEGSYTLVTGAAGERVADGIGLLTIAVSAQFTFGRVLMSELRRSRARFNEVRIAARVERRARDHVVPSIQAGRFFVQVMQSDQRSEVIRYEGPPRTGG